MLIVVVMFSALSSQLRDNAELNVKTARHISTLKAREMPMARREMMPEMKKMACLYVCRVVTQTTRTWRSKESSRRIKRSNERAEEAICCA